MYKVVLTKATLRSDYEDYLFNSEEMYFPDYLIHKYPEILNCRHDHIDLASNLSTLELTFDSEHYYTLWMLKL